MIMSSNGSIFHVTGPLCGEFTDDRWIPLTKASDADVYCDLRLNKQLSKQSRRRWFAMPLRSLWRHCNEYINCLYVCTRLVVHLTLWGLVTHICISKLTFIGSDKGLLPGAPPSYYLNLYWNIVNWTLGNKLQWTLNRNLYIFIQENAFENDVWKWLPFCLSLNVLIVGGTLQHLIDSVINQNSSWGNSGSHHFQLNALVAMPRGKSYTE